MTHRNTAFAMSLALLLPVSVAHGEELSNLVPPPAEASPGANPAFAPTPATTPAPTPATTPAPTPAASAIHSVNPAETRPTRAPSATREVSAKGSQPGEADRAEQRAHQVGPFLNSGVHLRMSLGFGATNDLVGTTSTDDEDGNRSTVTGIGTVGEILIGAPMTREVVFGAGLWLSSMSSSSYFYDRGAPLPETMQRPRDFAMLGPFVDWYFARRPGLHAQAGLGFALLTGSGWARGNDEGNAGFGGGLSAAFGYDSWVSDTWKLGVLARVTAAVLAEREAGETWIHATTGFPALMLSATYN